MKLLIFLFALLTSCSQFKSQAFDLNTGKPVSSKCWHQVTDHCGVSLFICDAGKTYRCLNNVTVEFGK